jgi:hypothetical protein
MGIMRVMDQKHGDFEIAWDPEDETSVENAKKAFADLKAKRFNLFRMESGAKGEQLRDFDPKAEDGRMLAIPPMAGG